MFDPQAIICQPDRGQQLFSSEWEVTANCLQFNQSILVGSSIVKLPLTILFKSGGISWQDLDRVKAGMKRPDFVRGGCLASCFLTIMIEPDSGYVCFLTP